MEDKNEIISRPTSFLYVIHTEGAEGKSIVFNRNNFLSYNKLQNIQTDGIQMGKSRVLVVDDNLGNIHIIETILRKAEYQVVTATSGAEALEIAEQFLPDMILLDIIMPEMDGFETCKKLKELNSTREIPVIFLTAEKDAKSIIRGLELGAVDYLTKPFISAEFRIRIKTHLELRQSKEIITQKNIELKELLHKLKTTVDTVGHSNLELVKEIDEAGDEMSKEQILQKMKLNILEMMLEAGHEHHREEYNRLKAGARSGEIIAEDQKSVDDLLSQFGL
jgi:DNA-binding response OmpR family regulator